MPLWLKRGLIFWAAACAVLFAYSAIHVSGIEEAIVLSLAPSRQAIAPITAGWAAFACALAFGGARVLIAIVAPEE